MDESWQLQCAELKQRGAYLFKTKIWADYEFHINDVTIKAHRLILAMASPVFAAVVYGGQDCTLNLNDVQIQIFNKILEYIYSDNINITCSQDACELYFAARKLQLPYMADTCCKYLTETMDHSNVLNIFAVAFENQDIPLQEACEKVFKKKTKEALKSEMLEHLSIDAVAHLFALEPLNINNELNLFNAAVCYMKMQPQKESQHNRQTPGEEETGMKALNEDENIKVASKPGEAVGIAYDTMEVDIKHNSTDVCVNEHGDSYKEHNYCIVNKKHSKENNNEEHSGSISNHDQIEVKNNKKVLQSTCDEDIECGEKATIHETDNEMQINTTQGEDLNNNIRSGHNKEHYGTDDKGRREVYEYVVSDIPRIADDEEKLRYRPIINQIRFLTLTPQEFAECKDLSCLLTETELLALSMNICSRNTKFKLPIGFSTNLMPRTLASHKDMARLSAVMSSVIPNIRQITNIQMPPFFLRNLPWAVMAMIHHRKHEYSLFLAVKCFLDPNIEGWVDNTEINIKLESHTPLHKRLRRITKFKEPVSDFVVWATDIPCNDLLKPENGFVDDFNNITYELYINTEPHANETAQILVPNPVSVTNCVGANVGRSSQSELNPTTQNPTRSPADIRAETLPALSDTPRNPPALTSPKLRLQNPMCSPSSLQNPSQPMMRLPSSVNSPVALPPRFGVTSQKMPQVYVKSSESMSQQPHSSLNTMPGQIGNHMRMPASLINSPDPRLQASVERLKQQQHEMYMLSQRRQQELDRLTQAIRSQKLTILPDNKQFQPSSCGTMPNLKRHREITELTQAKKRLESPTIQPDNSQTQERQHKLLQQSSSDTFSILKIQQEITGLTQAKKSQDNPKILPDKSGLQEKQNFQLSFSETLPNLKKQQEITELKAEKRQEKTKISPPQEKHNKNFLPSSSDTFPNPKRHHETTALAQAENNRLQDKHNLYTSSYTLTNFRRQQENTELIRAKINLENPTILPHNNQTKESQNKHFQPSCDTFPILKSPQVITGLVQAEKSVEKPTRLPNQTQENQNKNLQPSSSNTLSNLCLQQINEDGLIPF